ncbi:MAG: hypothetical protein PHV85_01635, partial [Desulfovibrionaceae bacterium]|nr:hypothetical protein [Desulfovibrionaceae bacterium]
MNMNIVYPGARTPVERAFALSMTIKSFKGRRNVEVHLFRYAWDKAEEGSYPWERIIGAPIEPGLAADPTSSRRVVMEAFTEQERDQLVEYLKAQYGTRLSAITSLPLDFPVPMGLPALSDMTEGKDIGFVRFEKIPSYKLDFPLRGLYDLSQH